MNDFDDLDLDDITGETTQAEGLSSTEDVPQEADVQLVEQEEEPEDPWRACVARLEANIDKAWISIPEVKDGKLHLFVKEVAEATPEEFYAWLCHVLPTAKDAGIELSDMEEPEKRYHMHRNACGVHRLLKFTKVSLAE